MAALGAVPVGAAVGNRARGLQRGRQCVGLPAARSGAVARVSLGRGRYRRESPTSGSFSASRSTLWNGQDPILKERMFGLTGHQGNHGEDVKEYWFYLDATPSHSYLKCLYKYPQKAFPYQDLVDTNAARGKHDPEYELLDTGVFAEDRYFDVLIEYAKATPEEICIRITATNHGPDPAPLHLLPTLWFRNSWSWGYDPDKPTIKKAAEGLIQTQHKRIGERYLLCGGDFAPQELLFTENETNGKKLFDSTNASPYVKDAFHARVIDGDAAAVNPQLTGTKAAAWYQTTVAPGATVTLKLRLGTTSFDMHDDALGAGFDRTFATRIAEADEFYARLSAPDLSLDAKCVQRQAYASLIWSKQFYNYDVDRWLDGDPAMPTPPAQRLEGRNSRWRHLVADDILSMPDKWEYPWFAAWDLAFHMIPFAQIDPDFAKHQLILLCREWFMHPNGQLPAYEWSFDDVNPPVHAWAAMRVYQIEKRCRPTRHNPATSTSWNASSTSCCSTSPGGSTERMRRATISSRAVFWGWTISASSTAPPRSRPAVSSSRATAPRGWRPTV